MWSDNKRHVHGSYTYHDGGKYDGEWVDDKVRARDMQSVCSVAFHRRARVTK
jgi:hypothetical protein